MRRDNDANPVGRFAGTHVLAELHEVRAELLDDPTFLKGALQSSLAEAGATVCELSAHQFEPQGVTVVATLTESHASVHTYPEFGSVFVDVFTCGERADPEWAVHALARELHTTSVHTDTIQRGLVPAATRS